MKLFDGVPRAVWLIVALHGALLALYSVSFAPFRGPDEPQHTDLVRYVANERDYPRYDERKLGVQIWNAFGIVRFDVPAVRSRDLPEEGAPPRAERPGFDELGSPRAVIPDESNQLPSHPPLYYVIAASVSYGANEIWDELAFDQEVGILRLFDALMVLPLPLLAWLTARRLGAGWNVGLAASAAMLAVPQLHHIGASVTNDGLLNLLIALTTLLVARIATGDRSWRVAALVGVVSGLALLTKAFALFLPIWILLAFAVAVKHGWKWRAAAPRAGVALALAFVVGGWWWARNLLVFGQLQTGIKLLAPAPSGFEPDVSWWLGRYFTLMPWRFWGSFGWLDVNIPAVLAIVATAALIAAVMFGIFRAGARRLELLLMLVPAAAIAAMVAIGAFQGYLRTSFDEGLQGRYLFPGLVGMMVVAAWGLRRRWAPLVVLGLAGVMQLNALGTILGFYWGGANPIQEIGAAVAWSPWHPAVLLIGAVGLVAVASVTVAQLFREARPQGLPKVAVAAT
ncbi:MAG TPA: DUF2142 domain-containing protein [Acidimicrobiales bacterium]|nr:DUF2142 domain-containing protein [Acidimicrobiales bacterium]